jgi:quercetin dioxygenase-like cupin family protein
MPQRAGRVRALRRATRARAALAPIKPPLSGSAYLRAAAAEWQKSDSEGFLIKPLYEDPSRGEKTWLMKVEPGAFVPSHAHKEFEQFYVLEGSLYDEHGPLKAGDFVCRPPRVAHSAGSEHGALVLLVYTPHPPVMLATKAFRDPAERIESSLKRKRRAPHKKPKTAQLRTSIETGRRSCAGNHGTLISRH